MSIALNTMEQTGRPKPGGVLYGATSESGAWREQEGTSHPVNLGHWKLQSTRSTNSSTEQSTLFISISQSFNDKKSNKKIVIISLGK